MMTTSTTQSPERITRPPVVVVMGHVDHGKTTLLDTIRKTSVVSGESGGITQHIGAYTVAHHEKPITFIDTPGHEAFSAMRSRGARVADIAILVVAADDGVKPQTKEALETIREAKIPFIIALNKIDKTNADPDRVKKDLGDYEIVLEEWGGSVPLVAISAKSGEHVAELLDMVLLVADVEGLTYQSDAPATGVVIEAHLDSRRGNAATLLLRDGALSAGDFVLAGTAGLKARIIEGDGGGRLERATASMPALVVGFNILPPVGSAFRVFRDKREFERAQGDAEREAQEQKGVGRRRSFDVVRVPLVLKADVAGSLEALEAEIRKIVLEGAEILIVKTGVGDVTENDLKAISAEKVSLGGMAVGFHVRVAPEAEALAERYGVRVSTFSIIYEATKWIKETADALVPKETVKEVLGSLEVLRVFHDEPGAIILGGRVERGRIASGDHVEILHRGKRAGAGVVARVEENKQTVSEVTEGKLCGISLQYRRTIEEGDRLVPFVEKAVVERKDQEQEDDTHA